MKFAFATNGTDNFVARLNLRHLQLFGNLNQSPSNAHARVQ